MLAPAVVSGAGATISGEALLSEAAFYGVEPLLSPPPLLGFSATASTFLSPPSEPFPSALSASPSGALSLAHGAGLVSLYTPSLSFSSTFRTHLPSISSLAALHPSPILAAGSSSIPGIHFFSSSTHVGSLLWYDPSDTRVHKSKVTAIAYDATSSNTLFAGFECPHYENAVLDIDVGTLTVRAEIARQSGGATKFGAPRKVKCVPDLGLIFVSAVSGGSFGYSGYMRLWDPKSGKVVWETTEPGSANRASRFADPFVDADVDLERLAVYKLCSRSGDVGVADLRRLGDDPWVYLSSGARSAGAGVNGIVCCYKKQVFVGRTAGLEVWSELGEQRHFGRAEAEAEKGAGVGGPTAEGIYRRTVMDTEEGDDRGSFWAMAGGGDRLFVGRVGMEGVQVWESSHFAGAIAIR